MSGWPLADGRRPGGQSLAIVVFGPSSLPYLRPLRPGYVEGRRDVYNLFPLLVHTEICGPPYAQMVQDILQRYG